MIWIMDYEGESYTLPLGDTPILPSMSGRLPNRVLLNIDERNFLPRFGDHAIWITGAGPYAVLAYCGGNLTITRWKSIKAAIDAKRVIDGGGCGGGCCKAHLMIHIDAKNGHKARRDAAIGSYIAANGIKPNKPKSVHGDIGDTL